MKLTAEEKQARASARKQAKREVKDTARITDEKNRLPVQSVTITIEWRKSRTWGSNPHASAQIYYKNGTAAHHDGFTCSGCGYDKESEVISQVFNQFLIYKLYEKHPGEIPYGIRYFGRNIDRKGDYSSFPSFEGAIGTNCYQYGIAEFIGGKFEHIASGKTFDVYKYTDN